MLNKKLCMFIMGISLRSCTLFYPFSMIKNELQKQWWWVFSEAQFSLVLEQVSKFKCVNASIYFNGFIYVVYTIHIHKCPKKMNLQVISAGYQAEFYEITKNILISSMSLNCMSVKWMYLGNLTLSKKYRAAYT